jgi:hypothetical protein
LAEKAVKRDAGSKLFISKARIAEDINAVAINYDARLIRPGLLLTFGLEMRKDKKQMSSKNGIS